MSGELDTVRRARDSLANSVSTRESEHTTARASTSAYSKAVVASAKELHRQGRMIDSLKDELDHKDQAIVRARPYS
jgi:predicted  nucleic acid-binding Zn-ribbon protein